MGVKTKKIIGMALAVLLIFQIGIHGTAFAIGEAVPAAEGATSSGNAIMALSDGDEDIGDCYISAFRVKSVADGTAPFDADDEAGNDSSDSNRIVRSFDNVNYMLEYTTSIRDTSITGIDQGYVMVAFVLPCDQTTASFNMDTMNWMLDPVLTYQYADGTSGTTLDKTKTVVSQKLTGKRLLVNNESGNAIPGAGTLSVGVHVKAASNGYVLSPNFTVWMENNPESEKMSATEEVTVSAAPKFNIKVSRNSNANIIGYYDADAGKITSEQVNESDMYGRLQGYGIGLCIQNDTAEKGLKGIELPTGTITFDLRMSEEMNGSDVSYSEDYAPFFWDYRMNQGTSSTMVGNLGRSMAPLGQVHASGTSWQTNLPFNKRGNASGCCYDGGNMVIVQDESDQNLLHVTLDGYLFDMENFIFPDRWNSSPSKTISSNIGYFSVGYVQVLCRFKKNVEIIENVYIGLEASNMQAQSASGSDVTEEVTLADNLSRVSVTSYPSGSHSKRNFFYASNGAQLASVWSAGDSYTYVGEKVQISGHMIYTGDLYLTATNILQKFDDEAFEVPAGTTKYTAYSRSNSLTELGNVTTLFAAKPDKSGWASDDEMNNTKEEQLIYFQSIDELTAAGYTCVGVLWEVRDSKLYPNNGGGCIEFRQLLNIKSDVTPGEVYMTKNDVRSWQTSDHVFSWTEMAYDDSIGAYGLGDSSWESGTYVSQYTQPKYTTYTTYGKAVYENGTMVSGHTNSYLGGNSLLIIGNKTAIDIQVADRNGNNTKYIYDLDAGERTARFTVQPRCVISSALSEIYTSEATDTVTVTVLLPDGLHYNEIGVTKIPESVTENTDGTTTIVWEYENIKVKEAIDPIVFSTTIGDEGTFHDVSNNDTFTVSASISSRNDQRAISASNGNYATTSIAVVKLAASAVTKRVIKPLVELGETITYRLRYSNLSDVSAENAKINDVLPYNGDGRGSSFSGKYKIASVTADFTNAETTFADHADSMTLLVTKKDGSSSTYSGSVGDNEVAWSNLNIVDASEFNIMFGDVMGNEYIDIYVHISPLDNNGVLLEDASGNTQMPEDVYANSFSQYSDNQAAAVTSNVVSAQVVRRALSGIIWYDETIDGERTSTEARLSGKIVSLYRVDASEHDTAGAIQIAGIDTDLYEAFDVFGNKVSSVTTQADGSYFFDNLPSGDYYAVFTGTEGYGLTLYRNTSDTTVNSDGKAAMAKTPTTYEELKTALTAVYVADVQLPLAENMSEYFFESVYNDAGLTDLPSPSQTVAKLANKTGGVNLDVDTGEYIGDKETGSYATGEQVTYTITVTNTGDVQLQDITVMDDISGLLPYITNFQYSHAIGDELTTKSGNKANVVDLSSSDSIYVAMLDKLEPGDSVDLLCTGIAANVVQPVSGLRNEVSVTSSFDYSIDHSDEHIPIETPEDSGSTDGDDINITGLGSLSIIKKDSSGNVLPGVEFYLVGDDGTAFTGTTDQDGKLKFENLVPQHYTLTETKTVNGEALLAQSIDVSIPMELTEEEYRNSRYDESNAFLNETAGMYCVYDLTYTVFNQTVYTLPGTGVSTTSMYIMMTLAFAMMAAGIWILTKCLRRKVK